MKLGRAVSLLSHLADPLIWWWRALLWIADTLDGRPPSGSTCGPQSWTSRMLPASIIVLSAFPLTAVAFQYGASSVEDAFARTMGIALAIVILSWPLLSFRLPGTPRGRVIMVLLLGVVSFSVLRSMAAPAFGGLPARTGGDLGNHAIVQRQIFESFSVPPEGMGTAYGALYWLRTLVGADWVDAFRMVVESVLLSGAFVTTWISVAGFRSLPSQGLRAAAAVASLLASMCGARYVALPLLAYFECDGFFTQVAALTPLLLGACCYAVAKRRLARLLILIAFVTVFRYTYVLNLGDLLVVSGLAMAREVGAKGVHTAWRLILVGGIAGAFHGAIVAYEKLFPLHTEPGGFFEMPFEQQADGLLKIAAALVLLAALVWRCRAYTTTSIMRLSHFVWGMCLVTGLVLATWTHLELPVNYYIRKYPFCAMVLGSAFVGPIILSGGAAVLQRSRSWTSGVGVVAAGCLAFSGLKTLSEVAAPYEPIFAERSASAAPPYAYLDTYGDRHVLATIRTTLADERARFGGFITPRWPENQFVNALFYDQLGEFEPVYDQLYWGLPPLTAPGYCVFWYDLNALPRGLNVGWSDQGRAMAGELSESGHECESFRPDEQPDHQVRFCHRCYRQTYSLHSLYVGFHALEVAPDDPQKRWQWTNGSGHIRYVTSRYDGNRACEVLVRTPGDRDFSLGIDGELLGPGPRQAIPPAPPGIIRTIEISSDSFVPAAGGVSTDERSLGVMVYGVELRCEDP